MNAGWIGTASLRPFVEVLSNDVGYAFGASDRAAIGTGLVGTDSEPGPWSDHPVGDLTLWVALEPGADEMVSLRIDGTTASADERVHWLADLVRNYGRFGNERGGTRLRSAGRARLRSQVMVGRRAS